MRTREQRMEGLLLRWRGELERAIANSRNVAPLLPHAERTQMQMNMRIAQQRIDEIDIALGQDADILELAPAS